MKGKGQAIIMIGMVMGARNRAMISIKGKGQAMIMIEIVEVLSHDDDWNQTSLSSSSTPASVVRHTASDSSSQTTWSKEFRTRGASWLRGVRIGIE